MSGYYVFKPILSCGSMKPIGDEWRCDPFKLADDPYLTAYPFLVDPALRVAVADDGTYTIQRGDEREVFMMPYQRIDNYVKGRSTEIEAWCAVYDCLIQQSKILQSYYPDRNIDKV